MFVARARREGVILPDPFAAARPTPWEMVVEDVTDQGQRRPQKVARVRMPGERRVAAELIAPVISYFQGGIMALYGTERLADAVGRKTGYPQTWLCQFAPPFDETELHVVRMFDEGIEVMKSPRARSYEYALTGDLTIRIENDDHLRRPSTIAYLDKGQVSGFQLMDTRLEWMGAERFMLHGWESRKAWQERPAYGREQGWLCIFRMPGIDLLGLDNHGEPLRGRM